MKAEVDEVNPFLTRAESRNLPFLAMGNKPEKISEIRFRSINTIRRQIESARDKLGAKNAAHLVALAIQKGILHLSVWVLIVVSVPISKPVLFPDKDDPFDFDHPARVARVRLRHIRIKTRRKD